MKITKNLSATSLRTAMTCLARFKAEHQNYTKGVQGGAAKFGIAVHDTLESWVKFAWLDTKMLRTKESLLELWKMKHAIHYGGLDEDPAEYKLGVELLTRWFDRGDLFQDNREVLTVEVKEHFTFEVDGQSVSFTYIIDRLDRRTDTGAIVVVDYKTGAWAKNPEDLRGDIQVRIYALAMQIKYPDAPGVWVEFDFLKHENQPVGCYLSREDNAATWLALKAEVRKIIQAPDDPKPTLNDSCLFCPIKVSCKVVQNNVLNGGVMGYDTEELADIRANLDYQISAARAAIKEVDGVLMSYAKENDLITIPGKNNDLNISMSKRRVPQGERIAQLLGPERAAKYMKGDIGVKDVEALLKSDDLTDDEKKELRTFMPTVYGEPFFKAKAKSSLDAL